MRERQGYAILESYEARWVTFVLLATKREAAVIEEGAREGQN